MKKNVILLEEAYQVVKVRQYLLAEGYTSEQIDLLIERGLMDKVRRGAMIGAAALGMMGGAAKGDEVSDAVSKFKQGASQSISQDAQRSYDASKSSQQQENNRINDIIKQAFKKEISQDSKDALMRVIQMNNLKGSKVDELIKATAQKLGGDDSSHTKVYMTASNLVSR
jgi:hypothetical protein